MAQPNDVKLDKDSLDQVPVSDAAPGKGANDFNQAAVVVLRQRVAQAKTAGAVNVAVDINFLDELLAGCGVAMKHAKWVSNRKV